MKEQITAEQARELAQNALTTGMGWDIEKYNNKLNSRIQAVALAGGFFIHPMLALKDFHLIMEPGIIYAIRLHYEDLGFYWGVKPRRSATELENCENVVLSWGEAEESPPKEPVSLAEFEAIIDSPAEPTESVEPEEPEEAKKDEWIGYATLRIRMSKLDRLADLHFIHSRCTDDPYVGGLCNGLRLAQATLQDADYHPT